MNSAQRMEYIYYIYFLHKVKHKVCVLKVWQIERKMWQIEKTGFFFLHVYTSKVDIYTYIFRHIFSVCEQSYWRMSRREKSTEEKRERRKTALVRGEEKSYPLLTIWEMRGKEKKWRIRIDGREKIIRTLTELEEGDASLNMAMWN